MRIFTTATKDSKTGYEMVLSECSYNEAAYWLEEQIVRVGYCVDTLKTHTDDGLIHILIKNVVSGAKGRTYFYDEERGYLLGE